MKLETKRLILRSFKESDYDDLFEFLNQLKDDEFEGYPDLTYENGKKHLGYRLGSEEFIAIELKDNHKVIGNIYLGKHDYETRELGYIINKDYQRKGYAYEAIEALLKETFKQGTHRVYAQCDPRNECSWRLLEKCGLKREAHLRKNIYFHKDESGNPIWKDTYIYATLKESWGLKMNIELVKLSYENKDLLFDMMDEWLSVEQKFSPYAIRKNDYHDFDYYLENLELKEEKDGIVPDSTFFCLDKDRNIFVGAINIRHYLNENLILTGGHIGDGIRPSERRKGYATAMIGLGLEECKKLGIKKVLMTCDKDNIGSAKSIMNNGGVLENEVEEDGVIEQRYWIDLEK